MTHWEDVPPWDRPAEPDPDCSTLQGLLDALDAQAALLVDVATGGSPIDTVNPRYRRRRRQLNAALQSRAIATPFAFEDLWAWRGYWKAQDLTTYQSRRDRISHLARPARDRLESALSGAQVSDPGSSADATWAGLEVRVAGVVAELAGASSTDDLQDVGRRCREVLIDAARLLADASLVPAGTEAPKAADAKAWLELFLSSRANGRSHRELRAFVPVTWDLAQKVTHGDVQRVDSFAAAQATVLLVRVLQQLDR